MWRTLNVTYIQRDVHAIWRASNATCIQCDGPPWLCRTPNQAQPGRPPPHRRSETCFQRTAPLTSSTSNGALGQLKRVREEKLFLCLYLLTIQTRKPMLAFPKGTCRLVPGLHGRIARQISGSCRTPNQARPDRSRPRRRGKACFQRIAPCASSTSNGARGQVKRVREEKLFLRPYLPTILRHADQC